MFVYMFNMLQIPNVAWQSYLQLSLHFPNWVLGLTVMVGSFMTFAGVVAYKYFFFGVCVMLVLCMFQPFYKIVHFCNVFCSIFYLYTECVRFDLICLFVLCCVVLFLVSR